MSKHTRIWTVGIDVGDRSSFYCLLDERGEIAAEGQFRSTKEGLRQQFGAMQPALIALETGGHSRWMSELLGELGHEVIVANPHRPRLLTESDRKNDKQDARTLAEVAFARPALLAPIQHRSAEAQADLNIIRARDLLVEARTKLINGVRSPVKGVAGRIPRCASEGFTTMANAHLPDDIRPAAAPLLEAIDELSERIQCLDETVEHLAQTRYPRTALLKQIAGMGSLSALAFVLTIGDAERFRHSRDVGCWLGLRPKQKDSGSCTPQLRITKAGDQYLRRIMVSCAHYIVGPFGPDTDLRRWGLKLSERGGRNAKKRAVVAVARKRAVLLHRLWVTGEAYEPLRNAKLTIVAA